MRGRFQFWRLGWQQNGGDVLGHAELAGRVPARPIHQHDGMGFAGDMFADLFEM